MKQAENNATVKSATHAGTALTYAMTAVPRQATQKVETINQTKVHFR